MTETKTIRPRQGAVRKFSLNDFKEITLTDEEKEKAFLSSVFAEKTESWAETRAAEDQAAADTA